MPTDPRQLLHRATGALAPTAESEAALRWRLEKAVLDAEMEHLAPGSTAPDRRTPDEQLETLAMASAVLSHVRIAAPDGVPLWLLPDPCEADHGRRIALDVAVLERPLPHGVPEGEACRCSYRASFGPLPPTG